MTGRNAMSKIRTQIRRMNFRLNETGADPTSADLALWGALAVAHFASATAPAEEIDADPETLLSDLLADLMHWCDQESQRRTGQEIIAFESALHRARDYYNEEMSGERQRLSVRSLP